MRHSRGFLLAHLVIACGVRLAAQEADVSHIQTWAAPLYYQLDSALDGTRKSSKARPEKEAAVLTPPLVFVGIQPCRLVETRPNQYSGGDLPRPFGPPSMAAGEVRTFPIPAQTPCSIPSTALAY